MLVHSLALAAFVLLSGTAAPAPQGGPAPVVISTVARDRIAPQRTFPAATEAPRRARVGSEVEGKVLEVLARRGARVEAGAVLCRLRSTQIDLELEAARAERELRAAELTELKNGPRAAELDAARAKLRAAEADLTYREWSLAQIANLEVGKVVSEELLQQRRLDVRRATAARDEASATVRLLEEGTRPERIAQAVARLAAQEQAVQRLADRKAQHEIRAPFAGWVASELTEAGAWIVQGDPVAELLDLDPIEIVVPVPEDFAAALAVGAKASVTLDALPGQTLEGTVRAVPPLADSQSRTIAARISVANRNISGQPWIRAGMFAQVQLTVGEPVDSLVIPKDALVLGGPELGVYAVDPGPGGAGEIARWVGVKVLGSAGDRLAIQGEITEGARVVIRGNERLRPGQPVAASAAKGDVQK